MTTTTRASAAIGLLLCGTLLALPVFGMSEPEAREAARLLALLLDSGRVVLAEHQTTINDPSMGRKGFTPQVFERELYDEFKRRSGGVNLGQLDATLLSPQARGLLKGLVQAGIEVIQERQAVINEQFLGYKNVIPATWGTWTSEKFSLRNRVLLKQTALDFRNPNNAPDAFESAVLTRFAAPDYSREGEHIVSDVTEEGTRLRLLLPLYHKKECLACHGQPKGQIDISGYLKEGHQEGGPAGAISVALPIEPAPTGSAPQTPKP